MAETPDILKIVKLVDDVVRPALEKPELDFVPSDVKMGIRCAAVMGALAILADQMLKRQAKKEEKKKQDKLEDNAVLMPEMEAKP